MIPGSKRRVPPALAILFPLLALGVATPVLFPDMGVADFVRRGYPCLRLGLICSLPSAAAASLLMRRGVTVNPLLAMATAGAFSGLVGVGALALHCSVLNTPHILIWHLSTVAICAVVGALLGLALTWSRART
jgi:hypothetical protein